MSDQVLFLVGPTGSGKSKLALALAKKIKGEIISCDSMQVYRGLDIGTAKPTLREQKVVPHHLIDLVSPRSECSVFKHRQLALKAIQQIFEKGRIPMVVGGSGLYVKAIVDGLAEQPGAQRKIRQQLETQVRHNGLANLYSRLREIDPKRARAVHPSDKRRIIRAFEILESSHRSQADWERETTGLNRHEIHPVMFGLTRERAELYERIERRVNQMFREGWLEEVKRLRRRGLSKTARAAIGYREILEYLQGKRTQPDMEAEIKKRTRHLAKKQMTWFRRDHRIHWISISGDQFVLQVCQTIIKRLGK